MTDKKLATLAPARKAPKSLAERAMASLGDVMAAKESLAWTGAANTKMWQAYQTNIVTWAELALEHDADEVRQQVASLREATYGATDPRALRLMLGMMLDAIPNARALNGAAFLDAAVSTIVAEPSRVTERIEGCGPIERERGGFTNVVIVAAVRRIWRTATFCPSVAEILEALHAERRDLQSAVASAEVWLKQRAILDEPATRDRLAIEQKREAEHREREARWIDEERRRSEGH